VGAKVKFFAEERQLEAFPHPEPANRFFPNYFAKLKPQLGSHPKDGTVKRCVPFLEALSFGYVIPLWADVYVQAERGGIKIDFPENMPMGSSLSPHGAQQINDHPLSETEHGNLPLKWHNPWGIQTDSGYSVLITGCLNHMEKRFKILDGVVDTDVYYNQINFPFIWTGGSGEFFIPKGTPLAQVIPFKRTEYSLEVCEVDGKAQSAVLATLGTHLRNGYKENYWHKKREKKNDS
jgi:hypothetical protein